MTAFATIVGAIKTTLEAAPVIADNVTRARTRVIGDDEETCINIYFEGATPNRGVMAGAPIDWETRIVIDLYARSTTTSADLAIDTLLGRVIDRLMADTTLGGVVDDIGAPLIDAEYDSNGQQTGWVRLIYPVQHRTTNNTIA